jgi:hypothetical protein
MYRALLLLVLFPSLVAAQEQSLLRESVVRDAQAAWSKYFNLCSHVQGTMRSTKVDNKTGETVLEEGPVVFKLNGLSAVKIYERGEKPTRLRCINETHMFILDEMPTGSWKLKALDEITESKRPSVIELALLTRAGTETIAHSPWQISMAYACQGLLINATWLPAMFSAPSFKIVSVRRDYGGNKDLVRVDFEYRPEDTRNNPVGNGYVVLDASRYWLIKSAAVKASWPESRQIGLIFVENQFDDTAVGFPFASRHRSRTISAPFVTDRQYINVTTMSKLDADDRRIFDLETYAPIER